MSVHSTNPLDCTFHLILNIPNVYVNISMNVSKVDDGNDDDDDVDGRI